MSEQRIFQTGDRVLADHKPGTVVFVRMARPDYNKADCYSVRMDNRADDPSYAGSIWPACDVFAIDEEG